MSNVNDVPSASVGDVNVFESHAESAVSDLLLMLWRRKTMIACTVIVSTLLMTWIVLSITPKYTAAAFVSMERRGMNITNWDQVASGLPHDEVTFMGEIELLLSRDFAKKVVQRLQLQDKPEFNKRSKSIVQRIREALGGSIPLELFEQKDDTNKDGESYQKESEVLNLFQDRLKVSPVGLSSRVMKISFTSEDSQTAADVPNTLAKMYIGLQRQTKIEAVRKANKLLNEHVVVLRQKVEESENAVETFRRESGLLKGKQVTLTAQQTAELNSQLVLAEAARAEALARLRQTRRLITASGGAESAAKVLQSPLVQNLRQQQAELERKSAELSIVYGPLHPKMIRLKAEKGDLQSMIKLELDKIAQAYENEASIAEARYSALQKSLDRLQIRVGNANSAEVGLRTLEREAKANQMILEAFLNRYKETSLQQDLNFFEPDAKIISHADVPVRTSSPKVKLFIAIAFVCSLFAGIVGAFLVESFDRGLRSSAEIEAAFGSPVLALIPEMSGLKRLKSSPQSYIVDNRLSAIGESFRSLQTGIVLSDRDRSQKTILITSAYPREGKTAVAVSLARTNAMSGKSVVVVDADFRRPGVGRALSISNSTPGLADVLLGEAALAKVIQKDGASGAHVITAGSRPEKACGRFSAKALDKILMALGETFDMVIVDSSPTMAVSDALLVSSAVDETILVVRWAKTRRAVVEMSIRQIKASGGKLAGFVLSRVNVRKHASYAYPDSGIYRGPLKKYYTG